MVSISRRGLGTALLSLLSYLRLSSAAAAAVGGWESEHSFGHVFPIAPSGGKIPNWEIQGTPHLLSDRIVLTPPVPGNQRSAVWNYKYNNLKSWEAEIPFRTSGPERAGGSFHVWYTVKGPEGVGTTTVYSSKPFDGLAIVVDSYGGRTGSLRAYLNDGTTDYSLHHQPQSLAFGHCDLNYRNLGSLTTLKINYSPEKGMRVETNGQLCFETDKVKLPEQYHFGVSAASADSPDSFELFGFKIKGTSSSAPLPTKDQKQQPIKQQQQQQQQQQQKKPMDQGNTQQQQSPNRKNYNSWSGSKFESTDSDYHTFKTQEDQFKELHNRLQAMTHQIAELQKSLHEAVNQKFSELRTDIKADVQGSLRDSKASVDDFNKRMTAMDRQVMSIAQNIKDDGMHKKIDDLHNIVKDHHSNLIGALPSTMQNVIQSSGPRIGMAITILIVFQALLAIAYVLYKRRRSVAPKKFL